MGRVPKGCPDCECNSLPKCIHAVVTLRDNAGFCVEVRYHLFYFGNSVRDEEYKDKMPFFFISFFTYLQMLPDNMIL